MDFLEVLYLGFPSDITKVDYRTGAPPKVDYRTVSSHSWAKRRSAFCKWFRWISNGWCTSKCQIPPTSHSKGFQKPSKHKTEVQDMQIMEKVGYRTAPRYLSCTSLLVWQPCPVPQFCTSKSQKPFKMISKIMLRRTSKGVENLWNTKARYRTC